MMLTARRVVGLVVMAVIGSACTLASPTYITTQQGKEPAGDGGKGTTTGSPSGDTTPATCKTDDFIKPDLSKLKACADGKGHCYDKTKTAMSSMLVACDNAAEVCVPDEMLEAGGAPLKSCKSIIGDGACVTIDVIPRIKEEGGSALSQDTCDADQKCIPCVDPRNGNAPSGFCEPTGVHENACSAGAPSATGGDGGAKLPGCCTTNGKSNGVCLPETAIPEKMKDQTIDDTCTTGNKCVPAALVDFKPVKCNGGMILGKGICVDKCFNNMMAIGDTVGVLGQDVCSETEVCIPCRFLKGTGAPGCE
jgi:hypothetical protein